MSIPHLHRLIGLTPAADALVAYLSAHSAPSPQIKSYSDAVYYNYHSIGLSLQFAPDNLDSIYIYNSPTSSQRPSTPVFSPFPDLPLLLEINQTLTDKDGNALSRPPSLPIEATTTGKDFVAALGEPSRKGGGAGPSSGSIGIWCEWSRDGIMVEFGGDQAKGPQAWETGKDAVWRIITIFAPTPN